MPKQGEYHTSQYKKNRGKKVPVPGMCYFAVCRSLKFTTYNVLDTVISFEMVFNFDGDRRRGEVRVVFTSFCPFMQFSIISYIYLSICNMISNFVLCPKKPTM